MTTNLITIKQDQLTNIKGVSGQVTCSTGDQKDRYRNAGEEWISNEIYCRESIEVDADYVQSLIDDSELDRDTAIATAVVDAIAGEWDSKHDWVPEGVTFEPIL